MNKEQMVSWLAIEGWELAADKLGPPLLRNASHRIWISTSGEVVSDLAQDLLPEYLDSEYAIGAEKVTHEQLVKLCAYVQEEGDTL